MINQLDLNTVAGGQLAAAFQEAFKKVLENMLDPNCSPKDKRKITIDMIFTENEQRNQFGLEIKVKEKLVSNYPIGTLVYMGKDLNTGEIAFEESGSGLRGQLALSDFMPEQVVDGTVVDTDTGEVIEQPGKIVRYAKEA